MKKTMKRLAITTMALFALLGAGGTIAYASGYISWAGTADYQQTLVNLGLIADRGDQLQTDKQNLITEKNNLVTEYEQLVAESQNTNRENEQLLNVIKDKENQSDILEQQIEALDKRIADGQTTRDQLIESQSREEQAAKDMKHVKEKADEVLEGLQNE